MQQPLEAIALEPHLPATFLPEPEREPLWCPIISVDDHVVEGADLFRQRVPAKLRDRVPRLVDDEEGLAMWTAPDWQFPVVMSDGPVGRPMREWGQGGTGIAPLKRSDMRRGVYDVDARVADMDLGGVWASVCFPSLVWGFAGKRFGTMADPDLGLACLRAYNDWHLEEWCGAHPDRFIPQQLPWLADPVVAAEEVRRNAARGFRAVAFSENPEGLGYPSIHTSHWDSFFAACEETGTVVNLHVGSSGSIIWPSTDSPRPVMTALFTALAAQTFVDWIFSGVPVRFPELRVMLSEGGVSWVPMTYERLERAHRQRDAYNVWTSPLHPIEVAQRNFRFASIEDPAAFRLLDVIGEDNVTIEVDYPHMDTTWPTCQSMARTEMAHLDVTLVRKVCFGNAAALYRHPTPPADWLARSEVGAA